MPNLVNVVHFKVREGYLDKIRDAMLENAASSLTEEDCYQFDVIVAKEDDHSFMFYEVYKDEAALAAHREQPYFKKYFALVEELGDAIERSPRQYLTTQD